MIHIQNVIKHAAKSKKTGPSDKERTFTCLGCYAVNPWTRTLSIWQKISLYGGVDIRFMGSPFILCHPAGLRIGLISSKYWFSQKINSQNLCTEFTSSNNFIMWLERITLLSLQFCQTTADFEQAIEYNE